MRLWATSYWVVAATLMSPTFMVRSSPVNPGRTDSAVALKSTTSPPPGRTAAASAATNVRVPSGSR